MTVGVVVFPGSNCDHDTYHVVKHVCGRDARFVWHKEADIKGLDAVILPGGFSYGDYLRTGAIARFAPVMRSVAEFARKGGPVLGICNGFQILQEAGLLPGAMLRNRGVRFLSQTVHIRIERDDTMVTRGLRTGQVLAMPIAHGEGNFYAPDAELDRLEGEGQVVFRYAAPDGRLDPAIPERHPHRILEESGRFGIAPAISERHPQRGLEEGGRFANPNGSARAIAGVCNARRNVVGLMPHPERASEKELGSADGRLLFEALFEALRPA